MLKNTIRKFIPESVIGWYHLLLAYTACALYGFPSRKLTVIGVTGTKGKSTTCFLIAKILEKNGFKVGLSGNVIFKVAEKEWPNRLKMTMPGRFFLQRLMQQMVKAGCTHAIIETTSEGMLQHRHRGIAYDTLVFTNLSPEHIERHGGFENYKATKLKLFESLEKTYQKLNTPKIIIANTDNEHAVDFLKCEADQKITVGTQTANADITAENIHTDGEGSRFEIKSTHFNLHLLGGFNVPNTLLAIAVGKSLGLTLTKISEALDAVPAVPGRMEIIREGQNFTVIVDYAYEPRSAELLYQTAQKLKKERSRIITITGSAGGGRDTSRRPVLGKLAAQYCDLVFVANEDPYDDDPQTIIDQVTAGAEKGGKILGKNLFKILDRREAIEKAFAAARKDDIVLLTAKGSEKLMAVAGGKYIPWSDQEVAHKVLRNIRSSTPKK